MQKSNTVKTNIPQAKPSQSSSNNTGSNAAVTPPPIPQTSVPSKQSSATGKQSPPSKPQPPNQPQPAKPTQTPSHATSPSPWGNIRTGTPANKNLGGTNTGFGGGLGGGNFGPGNYGAGGFGAGLGTGFGTGVGTPGVNSQLGTGATQPQQSKRQTPEERVKMIDKVYEDVLCRKPDTRDINYYKYST
ncbi:MAG: hypothetical protein U9Q67_04885, partial [Patescibacteria group bacterium]|nr:hypothetical protein [Patescibacteria group bacterium]